METLNVKEKVKKLVDEEKDKQGLLLLAENNITLNDFNNDDSYLLEIFHDSDLSEHEELNVVDEQIIDQRRWSILKEVVYELIDGNGKNKYVKATIDEPATEMQEGYSIEFSIVQPHEKTIIVFY